MGLSNETRDALLQRSLSAIRYADLEKENAKLEGKKDAISLGKIVRNKLDMQRVNHAYHDHYEQVKNIEPEVNKKIEVFQNIREENKTQKKAA